MIQTSSVLPGLKEQGFHVCVNTTPKGLDILRNDPHVDEFLIQEDGWVPVHELDDFWLHINKSFEKHINLSESVEGSLLALQGRHQWNWATAFRDMVMNVDYLEGMHAIAGVPYHPAPKFYPNNKEKKWAKKWRDKMGRGNFVVMWSIAGSSVHKIYPFQDIAMAECLARNPRVKFVLVGDYISTIGEVGWEKEPRVQCKSDKWKIRETLSAALECDMIIGPETGILNVVSYEPMPKGLILSHSSPCNIGGSWHNTEVFEPHNTECWPCHKLHFGFNTCTRDEATGAAACAASIEPSEIAGEILFRAKMRKAA